MEHAREMGLLGLLGSNYLGVGVGYMLISKGGGDSGLGRGGHFGKPSETFTDRLFGAHKKVSEKAWRLISVQEN